MDSGNSESLQSSSDDYDSSFSLPPFQPPSSSTFYGGSTSSSSATYLNFVNNLISNEIHNQTHLLPSPPPPPPPSSSRNPRKRTRASKKPTTTILTTNTSNFRAMVQEFTGVPASPFSLPFSSTTRRFRSPNPHIFHQPLIPSNQYHHTTTSMHFPVLPLPHNHQVSTLSSLHDLESMNLEALQQNQDPMADGHHELMMRQFSEFDRRTEKTPEIHDNMASSSLPLIKDSSGIITSTTTTDDLWIFPTDSNN